MPYADEPTQPEHAPKAYDEHDEHAEHGNALGLDVSPLDDDRNPLTTRLPWLSRLAKLSRRFGRRDGRGRTLTLAATTLLVVVAVVGLFAHATSNPGGALGTLLQLPTATPAATFAPGANVVYFSNGAPWGTLTLDGRRLPSAALTGGGVDMARGRHRLVYQARYFPSLTCTLSAPASTTDTCPNDRSDAANQFLLGIGRVRIITLGSTGATMQRDQLTALTRLADAQLQAQAQTVTIPAGESYLDDHGQVVVASAPLRFTMTLALSASGASTGAGAIDPHCAQFCPDPAFEAGGAPPGDGWSMQVGVTASWAISGTAGNRLTSPGYQAGQPFPETNPTLADVQLTAQGWRMSGLGGQVAAAVTNAAFSTLSGAMSGPSGSGGGYSAAIAIGRSPLEGCVMDVSLNDTGNGGGPTARLFWRFGVLLAVDAKARQAFPQLHVATAAQQTLAAAIVTQSQQAQ